MNLGDGPPNDCRAGRLRPLGYGPENSVELIFFNPVEIVKIHEVDWLPTFFALFTRLSVSLH